MQHGVPGERADRQGYQNLEDLVEVAALHDGNDGNAHQTGKTNDGDS